MQLLLHNCVRQVSHRTFNTQVVNTSTRYQRANSIVIVTRKLDNDEYSVKLNISKLQTIGRTVEQMGSEERKQERWNQLFAHLLLSHVMLLYTRKEKVCRIRNQISSKI